MKNRRVELGSIAAYHRDRTMIAQNEEYLSIMSLY
jgi:hypothetical protein